MPGTKRTATGVLGGLLGLVGLSAVAGLLITATVTPALAVAGTTATRAVEIFDNIPDDLQIDQLMLPTIFYYKNQDTGKYQEMTRFYEQNRSPVTYDQIAPVMIDALLSSEDARYFTHGGIDMIGTARAFLKNSSSTSGTQGGSSISQQYVKNVLIQRCESSATTEEDKQKCFLDATDADGASGYERKLQEMRYAISLEQKYSKETILLGYLNIANFGGVNYGIDAAARYYFGIPAAQLNLSQAATLAGMVQNPNTFAIDRPDDPDNGAANGYAETKKRQESVLDRMLVQGKITQAQYDAAKAAPIEPKITPTPTGCAAAVGMEYYCQLVKSQMLADPAFGATDDERRLNLNRGGLKIYTSLDSRLQANAVNTMNEYAPATVEGMNFGSTAVNIETTTGRILAIGQNTHFGETEADAAKPGYSSLVYAGDSRFGTSTGNGFPVGSTFKLFTLINWLENGHSVREVLNGVNRGTFKAHCGDTDLSLNGTKIGNFASDPGWVGTPMQFTAQSLNSGYFAMAEQLDLCDIGKDATKLGATLADGKPVDMTTGLFAVLGSNAVSPIAMGGAYAAVANKGIYCTPRIIDQVTTADGTDQPDKLPKSSCTQQITPEVAATAAYALAGVTNGGSGNQANPYDGTPVVGKTGTHEDFQTWMIETSTKVTSVAWVGNEEGYDGDLFNTWVDAGRMADLRYGIARNLQHEANLLYGGDDFPAPDNKLTRQIMKDLPSVIGLSVADATAKLQDAGFQVTVGPEVDGPEAKGLITAQNPGAGQVASGATVTISPSNGNATKVPDVTGKSVAEAVAALNAAGFTSVSQQCQEQGNLPPGQNGKVTGTNPAAGTAASKATAVVVQYARNNCS